MLLHERKFVRNFIEVYFLSEKQILTGKFQLNSGENLMRPIKSYTHYILFCIHLRFNFIKQNNDKAPMQNLSTTPKKTDLNFQKKRPENCLQIQPKEATLQKILQFASSHRVERISENQFIEWYLN
jgi:hypothetical protein